jgi:hypothetical protein
MGFQLFYSFTDCGLPNAKIAGRSCHAAPLDHPDKNAHC